MFELMAATNLGVHDQKYLVSESYQFRCVPELDQVRVVRDGSTVSSASLGMYLVNATGGLSAETPVADLVKESVGVIRALSQLPIDVEFGIESDRKFEALMSTRKVNKIINKA